MNPKIVQISAIDVSMNNMLSHLNKRSKENGYEVHCICSPGDSVQKIIDEGYTFHPIQIHRKISPLKNIQSIYRIYKTLRRVKPEIVHVHTPIAGVLGRIAAKLAKVDTVIYTAHGFYFHDGMNKFKYNLFFNIEKFMGKYFTDYIFTQSEEDYKLAKENEFLKQNNYFHISNGIDITNKFNFELYPEKLNESIRRQYGNTDEESILITFVGRLVKEKGILDLIKATQILENKIPFKLIVLGNLLDSERDKSLINELKQIEEASDNITFAGRVSNVEEYLYASDIFVLPSYREGMPRSIIEAMAMKNAIIATNIRGSREEVDNEFNGYLIDLNSPQEIADKIIDLYNSPGKLRKMKMNSFKKATQLYDEEKVVKKQLEIFGKIILGDNNE